MPAAHHAVHVKCAFLVCRLSSGVLDHIQHQPRPKPMNPHHIAVFFSVRARESLLRRLRQLCRRIEGATRFQRWGRHGFDGIDCGLGGMSGCGHP